MKKYKLTDEEINNLKGRERFSQYIIDLVQRDIAMYLSQEIYKRLNLPADTSGKISEDREWLEVDEIIKPTKEEVSKLQK